MIDIYFWRQVLNLLAKVLFSLGIGFMLGYPAVLNSAITAGNSTDITTTRDHVTWITAINGIGGIIGSIILPPILQIWGRRAVHITMNAFHIIGWTVFATANNVGALYAARLLQGTSVGGIYINCIIVSEYVHPSRRGIFITITKVSIAVGTLLCHSMKPFWSWRQIATFAVILPTLALILTLFWPESPSFLALRGRFNECEKAFKWLHGSGDESQRNLRKLLDSRIRNEERKRREEDGVRGFLKGFLKKDFLKAIVIVSLLTLCIDLCGRYYFVAYITEIMTQLVGDKSNVLYFTVGADLLTVVALLISSIIIRHFNRRSILFYLGGISVLLMFLISLIVLSNSVFSSSSVCLWVAAFVLILHTFIVNISVQPVSFAMIGEVIPLEHKGIGMFASGIVFTTLYTIILKLTPLLMKHTDLYGTYAIYGVILSLCLLWLYKILPETKDRTLEEIEDDLKGEVDGQREFEKDILLSKP